VLGYPFFASRLQREAAKVHLGTMMRPSPPQTKNGAGQACTFKGEVEVGEEEEQRDTEEEPSQNFEVVLHSQENG